MDRVFTEPGKMKWTCLNCGPLPVNDFYAYDKSNCKKCRIEKQREKRVKYYEGEKVKGLVSQEWADMRRRIAEMLRQGHRSVEISTALGCSRGTVCNVKKRMMMV